jgi:hypothetical protein
MLEFRNKKSINFSAASSLLFERVVVMVVMGRDGE